MPDGTPVPQAPAPATPPAPTPKCTSAQSLGLLIALIVLVAVGFLALYFKFDGDSAALKAAITAAQGNMGTISSSMMELNERMMKVEEGMMEKKEEEKMMAKKSFSITDATLSIKDFSFSYPKNWTAVEATSTDGRYPGIDYTQLTFLDENSAIAAFLSCPTPEIGFEAWDFKQSKRTFEKNKKTYEFELWLGTPSEGIEDTGDLNVILMKESNQTTLQNSCMLISKSVTADDVYTSIYESIK